LRWEWRLSCRCIREPCSRISNSRVQCVKSIVAVSKIYPNARLNVKMRSPVKSCRPFQSVKLDRKRDFNPISPSTRLVLSTVLTYPKRISLTFANLKLLWHLESRQYMHIFELEGCIYLLRLSKNLKKAFYKPLSI
jgi:hypothetical protein